MPKQTTLDRIKAFNAAIDNISCPREDFTRMEVSSLILAALLINDKLHYDSTGAITFDGSTNDIDAFRTIVNARWHKLEGWTK